MTSRWFNVAVVMVWMTTMTWLVTKKIWPSLDVGRPPGYSTEDAHTRWELLLDEQPIGWAETTVALEPGGVRRLNNEVYLDELPLDKLGPVFLLQLVQAPEKVSQMRVRSSVAIDPLDRLISVHTAVDLGSITNLMTVHGEAEGDKLNLTATTGNLVVPTSIYVPRGGAVGEVFSPRTRLGKLELGQHWTVPVYSPFLTGKTPLEILHARVENEALIIWNRQIMRTLVVAFRSDPGSGVGNGNGAVRLRAWVDERGRVLRQEVTLWSAQLTFVRLPVPRERPRDDLMTPAEEAASP